jgi:Domain of Unknown Function (DUF1080)
MRKLRATSSLAAISLLAIAAKSQAPAGRPRGGGFTHPEPVNFEDHAGWTSLWDGKTLNGWSGDSNWKVENGAIVIESSCEKPTGTIYLVWQGGEAADFELKLEMKGEGDINGGVQYRSWIVPDKGRGGGGRQSGTCPSGQPRGAPPSRESEVRWNMAGPQYDFDAGNRYTGQFYEQATGRGIVAWRGDAVQTETGKPVRLLGSLGDIKELGGYYKANEFNQLHIIARGHQMTQILNGHVVAILMDDDKSKFHASGKIGIEVESTGKLSVRNIWLRKW